MFNRLQKRKLSPWITVYQNWKLFQNRRQKVHLDPISRRHKVIARMVIGLLDDHTYCARCAFTHLGLWRNMYNCSLHHFTTIQCILKCDLLTFSATSNRLAGIWKGDFSTPWFGKLAGMWIPISSSLTHMVYRVPFLSDFAGSTGVSDRRSNPVRWQIAS